MSRTRALLLSVLAATSALAAIPPTASAGETKWPSTKNGPYPDWSAGYTRAAITVEFLSKRSYDIQGWVEDVCPQDGNGAYLRLRIETGWVATDTNGCDTGRVYFDPPPVKRPTNVSSLWFDLCEIDADGNDHNTHYCTLVTFDNWRL